VSATSVNVTSGDAHIMVTMSVSDPDATGVGTGDVIAHGPTRGYNPSGHLVQVGGTAANTQYRADITLPAAPAHLTFHRELQGGMSTIVVSWAAPAAGQPVPTGSTVTGSGCGTLQSSNAADARFTGVPKSATTCTATVSLLNCAGSSPSTTASARV
jgi:hypothetical protein